MNDTHVTRPSRLDELAVERNRLAIERNALANERTILAYLRTSIMAFLTGLTLFEIYPHAPAMRVMAWISVVGSIILLVIGVTDFMLRYRSLSRTSTKREASPR